MNAKYTHRGELLKALNFQRAAFETSPLPEHRFRLCELLYQAGSFWEAWQLIQPLLQEPPQPPAASLAANLAYLLGRYIEAERILLERIPLERIPLELIPQQADDPAALLQSELKLLLTYYQTGRYDRAHSLFKGQQNQVALPLWEQMKSFENPPFQVDWQGQQHAEVNFLITDPLPIIQVELQGKLIFVLIDTGGDNLYLDNEYADELGIQPVASAKGTFGGGKQAEIGFARGRELRLGGVTLDPVPVTILPTQRWSKGFADGKYTIGGVVGTGILRQFLATMDYPAGQLLLQPRNWNGTQITQPALDDSKGAWLAFVLHSTHAMMAKGSLNGFEDLTFFVDSGLAMQASLAAPQQTLEYTGIALPETTINEDSIGGGGEGLWATGLFPIQHLGLGSLVQQNVQGEYGSLTPETYWRNGFIQDGLISHSFLRQFRWTLDFDRMQYYFEKPD